MITCDAFTDQIVPYVDGELPSEEKSLMDAHRMSCSSCRELYDGLAKTLDEQAQCDRKRFKRPSLIRSAAIAVLKILREKLASHQNQ